MATYNLFSWETDTQPDMTSLRTHLHHNTQREIEKMKKLSVEYIYKSKQELTSTY